MQLLWLGKDHQAGLRGWQLPGQAMLYPWPGSEPKGIQPQGSPVRELSSGRLLHVTLPSVCSFAVTNSYDEEEVAEDCTAKRNHENIKSRYVTVIDGGAPPTTSPGERDPEH